MVMFWACPSIPYLPLMTGVKTAMPAKFGLDTVLSRIRPPTLRRKHSITSNSHMVYEEIDLHQFTFLYASNIFS